MEYLTLVLLGLSLSMDTLAVSVTIGICKSGLCLRHALKVGLFFAVFQAMMPVLGWIAGTNLIDLIRPVDHWIAFALLAFIGGKLIFETLHEKTLPDDETSDSCPVEDPTSVRRLTVLALATSIDALAAGISLALVETPIVQAALIIGLITFLVAVTGTLLGKRLGVLFQRNACLVGGAVLILLGGKIVLEHLI